MAKANSQNYRNLAIESLESRRMLASLPLGATPADTGEYMLGRIAVTPVLLESNGAIDPSTENWDTATVNRVMANIEEGLQWWSDLLATKSTVHTLDWVIDRTFVDNRVATSYEPISRISNDYSRWVPEFLNAAGFAATPSLESNIRAFNNAQREKLDTDWSFTIFVVNSESDSDGNFATGGSFSRAFAFAGGLFQVIPSTRPASTYAHETGHMFWARDEYPGSGRYNQQRGYYNAQNTNAVDGNPTVGFVQEPSIMASGITLDLAWFNIISADSTLAQIGWRDSDGDGIFDVLDVPLKLEGTGRLNESNLVYEFTGMASAQAYPNRNSVGTQNDITLNKVDRVEYRLDDTQWITIQAPEQSVVDLSLRIPVSATNRKIEIRAVDSNTGIQSNLFTGELNAAPDRTIASGLYGFTWFDADNDSQWDRSEPTIPGAQVTLLDEQGAPLPAATRILAADLPVGNVPSLVRGVYLEAIGLETNGRLSVVKPDNGADPYFRTFNFNGQAIDSFSGENYQLRARFATPQREVSIDAIAPSPNTNVRLEAYDDQGNLIQRTEVKGIENGQRATLIVGSTAANIAYVVARSFDNSHARFDNLVLGSTTTMRTSADGSYAFPNIAPGKYQIRIAPVNANHVPSAGSSWTRSVTVTAGSAPIRADFSVYAAPSPWQNPVIAADVDGDGSVSPLDALVLINSINREGSRPLTTEDLGARTFLDPDGDNFLGPLDVLLVINYVNNNRAGENGSGEQEAPFIPSTSGATNDQSANLIETTESVPLATTITEVGVVASIEAPVLDSTLTSVPLIVRSDYSVPDSLTPTTNPVVLEDRDETAAAIFDSAEFKNSETHFSNLAPEQVDSAFAEVEPAEELLPSEEIEESIAKVSRWSLRNFLGRAMA